MNCPHLREGQAVWVSRKQHAVVGQILADLRRGAGATQQELAAKLRKPQSFISAYEAGQRRIDVPEFIRITRLLGGDPTAVFSSVDKILETSKRARLGRQ